MSNLADRASNCRRGFLRGVAGGLLALPWLESISTKAQDNLPSAHPPLSSENQGPPLRFACIYFSNGVEPEHWWAKGAGRSMEIGPGLQPMLPHRDDLVFVRGLFNEQAAKHPSAHLGRIPNLLSGAWVNTDQNQIRVGRSMDQVLAQHLGRRTTIPSLVLGIEPTELRLEDGLSMIYGSCISWTSDTKPATKEIYPARVFDLLVRDGAQRKTDSAILDQVLADARSVRLKLSTGDQRKLDEYLESVHSIERRIWQAAQAGRLEGWKPTAASATMTRPAETLPHHIPDHMRLMLDLIVMAFQLDKTRLATCMLNNDLSQMNFGFLEGVQGSLHLDLTHNGRRPELEAMYLKTNQFHVAQFAYLVDRLKQIDEGGQSLLDNSLLMCCSNLFDGDKHQATEMPILLAGRAGGTLKTGRVLEYHDQPDANRRACSLYLSILERFGVKLAQFGDASEPLKHI